MEKSKEKVSPAAKKEFLERKQKMIGYEKRNFSTVVFFRDAKGFYIAGGHSAIILYNLVAPELHLKITLHKDTDYDVRFAEGVVYVHNIEKYKELFSGSIFFKGFEENNLRIIFRLKERLPKEKYELLSRAEDLKREKLVSMVSSSAVMPKTYQSLRELMKATMRANQKGPDAVARELLTYHVVEEARLALLTFLDGCKKQAGFSSSMNRVDELLRTLLAELIVAEAAGVWNMAKVNKMSYYAVQARTALAAERKEYEKK